VALSKIIELIFKIRGAGKAGTKTGEVDSALAKLAKTAAKVGASFFATRGLIRGLSKVVELNKEFARFDALSTAFTNLSKNAGFTSEALDKLKDATDGTVDSMTLMQMANTALMLDIVKTEDQMADMFDMAQRLGRAIGVDTTRAVEMLTIGLGRQSKLRLDDLGITMDVNVAYQKYARQLKKTTKALTDEERKRAFVNEALHRGVELVDSLGKEEESLADTHDRLGTSFTELGLAIGELFSPEVETTITNLVKIINKTSEFLVKQSELKQELKEARSEWAGYKLILEKQGIVIDETGGEFEHFGEQIEWVNNLMRDQIVASSKATGSLVNMRDIVDEVGKITKVSTKEVKENQASWLSPDQEKAVDMVRGISSNLSAAVIHGQNLGDAVVSSIKAIAIEVLANTAIFALLNAFTGGQFAMSATGMNPLNFLFGFTGQTPTVNNNINISGGLVSDSYVRNTLVPAMNRVRSFG